MLIAQILDSTGAKVRNHTSDVRDQYSRGQVSKEDYIVLVSVEAIIGECRYLQTLLSPTCYQRPHSPDRMVNTGQRTRTSSAISIFAPSKTGSHVSKTPQHYVYHLPTVPRSRPPLRQNFMFEVPDASVPAVEMC